MNEFIKFFLAYGGGYIFAGILLALSLDALFLLRPEKTSEEIKRFTAQGITVSALIVVFALLLAVMYGGEAAVIAAVAASAIVLIILLLPWVKLIMRKKR